MVSPSVTFNDIVEKFKRQRIQTMHFADASSDKREACLCTMLQLPKF